MLNNKTITYTFGTFDKFHSNPLRMMPRMMHYARNPVLNKSHYTVG
ncbi:MAG: hypothetical protein LBD89_02240 [Tannerellaceae bacterium]|jgi:hypothetical protein|nr:hypothetical protein [Tannerellaceae bacterium]